MTVDEVTDAVSAARMWEAYALRRANGADRTIRDIAVSDAAEATAIANEAWVRAAALLVAMQEQTR